MKEATRGLGRALKFTLLSGAVIWIVHALQVGLGFSLSHYGIYPREVEGLKGILLAPGIHGSWSHLIANTPTLMLMTFCLFFFYRKIAAEAYLLVYILTGISVWIFARSSFHIGASGVVYGLVSLLFWLGVFRRSTKSIVIALVVMFLYSGMFAGIFPSQPGVSWESHLLGGIMGIVVAYLLRSFREDDEQEREYELEDAPAERYFPEDLFQKSKEERYRGL